MRIGWLIPSLGTFGSVREVVEVSNGLVRLGHEVTLYHPAGTPCAWLPCAARAGDLAALSVARPDVLIGVLDGRADLYDVFGRVPTGLRVLTVMGLEMTPEQRAALRSEATPDDPALAMIHSAIRNGWPLLADSGEQARWLHSQTPATVGPSMGGINLAQFRPVGQRDARRVLATGDPRPRKGSDVTAAVFSRLAQRGLTTETYYGRRLTQAQLVERYAAATVFIDAHRRGGWCNPVAEALACGAAVACTAIPATRELAIDGETALVVPVDDGEALERAALRLLDDPALRQRLTTQALRHVRQFDYARIAERLSGALEEWL